MLEKIRQIAHHSLFKLFFFVLAVIFAASLGNFDQSKSNNVIATIGKEKISFNEFAQARQYALKQLNKQQHLTPEQAQMEANDISKNVINKMISQMLIKLELEHLGIKIPSEIIAEYIQKDESFHKNGNFDLDTYKQVLEYNNVTEESLLKNISTELASKFLLTSLSVNIPLKDTFANYLYDYLSEKRSISLISVDANKVSYNNFSQEELQNYHKNYPHLFQTKEYKSFSYLLLDSQKLKETINVDETDLVKEYNANKEEYALPETRDFHHFLTPDQEIANQIIESLNKDTDHLDVAKNFIDKKVISEKFINQSQQGFLSNLDPSLYTLQENQITSAVKSDLGWHVFKITKINPKQYKEFSEVKKTVQQHLVNKIAHAQLYELSKQIEDDISSGAHFTEIANRYNLKNVEVQNIAVDGSYLDSTKTDKIAPQIMITAFQTPLQQESQITPIDENTSFILKVEEIKAPKLESLEKVKDRIADLLLEDFRAKLSLEIARTLQTEASKDPQLLISSEKNNLNKKLLKTLLKPIFNKYNLSKNNRPIISIQNQNISRAVISNEKELPESFINSLFNLNIKNVSLPQNLTTTKYGFAIIDKIFIEKERNADLYQQVASISEDNYRNEIYNQYLDYLRNQYPVHINLKLLNDDRDE